MNTKELSKLFAVVEIEHPGFTTKERLELWFARYQHLDAKALSAALAAIMDKSPYPPKISEVNQELSRLQLGDLPSPEEAWAIAQGAASSLFAGCTDAVEKLPAPLRNAVRKIGSYEIRTSTSPEALGKRFAEVYKQQIQNCQSEAQRPTALPATPEAKENQAKTGQLIKMICNQRRI